jgi:hypothetical protein
MAASAYTEAMVAATLAPATPGRLASREGQGQRTMSVVCPQAPAEARITAMGATSDPDEAREARRRARARWPIRRYRLGEEPPDDLSDATTAAERIAMMWPLALAAWRLAGRRLPDYDRRTMPARLFPPGTRPPDDDDA